MALSAPGGPTRTLRASMRRRVPWQAGQTRVCWNLASSSRTWFESVSWKRRSKLCTMPSKGSVFVVGLPVALNWVKVMASVPEPYSRMLRMFSGSWLKGRSRLNW